MIRKVKIPKTRAEYENNIAGGVVSSIFNNSESFGIVANQFSDIGTS